MSKSVCVELLVTASQNFLNTSNVNKSSLENIMRSLLCCNRYALVTLMEFLYHPLESSMHKTLSFVMDISPALWCLAVVRFSTNHRKPCFSSGPNDSWNWNEVFVNCNLANFCFFKQNFSTWGQLKSPRLSIFWCKYLAKNAFFCFL